MSARVGVVGVGKCGLLVDCVTTVRASAIFSGTDSLSSDSFTLALATRISFFDVTSYTVVGNGNFSRSDRHFNCDD